MTVQPRIRTGQTFQFFAKRPIKRRHMNELRAMRTFDIDRPDYGPG